MRLTAMQRAIAAPRLRHERLTLAEADALRVVPYRYQPDGLWFPLRPAEVMRLVRARAWR